MIRPATTWTLLGLALALPVRGAEIDWPRFQQRDVIEVLTDDEGGARRETKVWIVTLDGQGYVRTNDSRWLANIRRGSPVALRLDAEEFAVAAAEKDDPELAARVEAAFKEKYGFVQSVMSLFRITEPTLLELRAVAAPGSDRRSPP